MIPKGGLHKFSNNTFVFHERNKMFTFPTSFFFRISQNVIGHNPKCTYNNWTFFFNLKFEHCQGDDIFWQKLFPDLNVIWSFRNIDKVGRAHCRTHVWTHPRSKRNWNHWCWYCCCHFSEIRYDAMQCDREQFIHNIILVRSNLDRF